jgi:hypothetical protein
MSHLRLATSYEDGRPSPGAVKFASFAPMNDQPSLADRKASFAMAAGGLLLSTTMSLVMPLSQFARPGLYPALVLSLAVCLVCAVLVAIANAYRGYMLPVPARPENPLFHRNIAARPAPAYAEALMAASPWDALLDVLDFNHTMSRLASAKYRLVGRALWCLRVAIPLWMLLLILVSLSRAA